MHTRVGFAGTGGGQRWAVAVCGCAQLTHRRRVVALALAACGGGLTALLRARVRVHMSARACACVCAGGEGYPHSVRGLRALGCAHRERRADESEPHGRATADRLGAAPQYLRSRAARRPYAHQPRGGRGRVGAERD